MKKHIAVIAFAAATLVPSLASAAARVDFSSISTQLEASNGAVVSTTLGAPAPGSHIRNMIIARNRGDVPSLHVAPVSRIPAGQHYIAGSATPAAEFSTDGGKTWSRHPLAKTSAYNAIRWVTPRALAPGKRMTFAYDAVVE